MVVQETSVRAHQGTTGLQIAAYNEAPPGIFDLRDLKPHIGVYLPAVRREAELVRWLAHAARAAASGNEDLTERCLDRCINLLHNSRDFRFAGLKRMH